MQIYYIFLTKVVAFILNCSTFLKKYEICSYDSMNAKTMPKRLLILKKSEPKMTRSTFKKINDSTSLFIEIDQSCFWFSLVL